MISLPDEIAIICCVGEPVIDYCPTLLLTCKRYYKLSCEYYKHIECNNKLLLDIMMNYSKTTMFNPKYMFNNYTTSIILDRVIADNILILAKRSHKCNNIHCNELERAVSGDSRVNTKMLISMAYFSCDVLIPIPFNYWNSFIEKLLSCDEQWSYFRLRGDKFQFTEEDFNNLVIQMINIVNKFYELCQIQIRYQLERIDWQTEQIVKKYKHGVKLYRV